MPSGTNYAIADLARLTGLNVRTIRYYIAQGLIPASGESGPGAHYSQGHLDRLRLTKRLQQQHLPLAEIRARLNVLSDDDVAGLVAGPDEQRLAPETSALDYIRDLLAAPSTTAPSTPMPSIPMPSVPPPRMSAPSVAPAVPPPPMAAAPSLRSPLARFARARVSEAPAAFASTPPPGPEAMTPTVAPKAPMAPKPIEPQPAERSQWERLSLAPNIELHVRRPLGRLEQRRVERLITIARQVLKEDAP